MTFEEEMINSNLSNLDRTVELIYRNCDCSFCKITCIKCPFAGKEEFEEGGDKKCKQMIKKSLVNAVKEFHT